jgi:hypothetical protein
MLLMFGLLECLTDINFEGYCLVEFGALHRWNVTSSPDIWQSLLPVSNGFFAWFILLLEDWVDMLLQSSQWLPLDIQRYISEDCPLLDLGS